MIKPPSKIVNRRARAVAKKARGEHAKPEAQRPIAVFRCALFNLSSEFGRSDLLKLLANEHQGKLRIERNSEDIRFTDLGTIVYYIEWRSDIPPETPIPKGFEFVVPRTQRRFGIGVYDLSKSDELLRANEVTADKSKALFYRGKRLLDDGRCPCLLLWYEDEPIDDGAIPSPGQR